MTDTNPKPHSTGASPETTNPELESLRAEVKRLTDELAKVREAQQVRSDDPVEHLRETAEDFAEDLSEKAQEGWDELQTQISQNPVQAALIAFGLGFVLSRLLSR